MKPPIDPAEAGGTQNAIVRDVCDRIKFEIMDLIARGKVPPEWNGHEIRWLILAKAQVEAGSNVSKEKKARYRKFKNHVVVENL